MSFQATNAFSVLLPPLITDPSCKSYKQTLT